MNTRGGLPKWEPPLFFFADTAAADRAFSFLGVTSSSGHGMLIARNDLAGHIGRCVRPSRDYTFLATASPEKGGKLIGRLM